MSLRFLVLTLAALVAVASGAHADPPEKIRLQGTISQLGGLAVIDDVYAFEISLYEQATGGSPLITMPASGNVAGGAYSLLVGPQNPGDLFAVIDQAGYVEIEVVSNTGGSINETLLPRQQLASVPFALNASGGSLPMGVIVLWTDPQGDEDCDGNGAAGECPCGFTRDSAFDSLTIRGADAVGSSTDVPEEVGVVSDDQWGGGASPECSGPADTYDDVISVGELAPHSHGLTDVSGTNTNGTGRLRSATNDQPHVPVPTDVTGSGEPHYHPFRTVLFCRKS